MKTFLFLLAWCEGSDSCDDDTNVRSQSDLMPEYLKGNEAIFALEIKGDITVETAQKWGYTEAFFNNYTAHDSVSECVEIPGGTIHPREIKSVVAMIITHQIVSGKGSVGIEIG